MRTGGWTSSVLPIISLDIILKIWTFNTPLSLEEQELDKVDLGKPRWLTSVVQPGIVLEKEPPLSNIDVDDLLRGGNLLIRMPRECLKIIESKSMVRNSRNKAVVAKVSSNSSTPGISPDVAALTTEVSELKNMMKTMLVEKQRAQAPAPVKAVEQSFVTCGGAHSE
ncbi:hypothetical protein Tco_0138945 [Tanacetum coccineum]